MLAGNWFEKRRSRSAKKHQPLKKGLRRKEAARGRALRVEELEDRRMLATFIVNNLGDLVPDGSDVEVGTLRQAVELSNASGEIDIIVFADFLFSEQADAGGSRTIFLDERERGGQIEITDEVQILGPGSGALIIDAGLGNDFRIFDINIDADNQVRPVTIGGVTLTGGSLIGTDDSDDDRGGAIRSREGLTLIETVITGNSASQGGGAIFQPIGTLNVNRSVISYNSSNGGGGGIFGGTPDGEIDSVTVNITNSTITGNSTFSAGGGDDIRQGYGGGVLNRSGVLNLDHSTIVGNSGQVGPGGLVGHGVGSWGNPPPTDLDIPPFINPTPGNPAPPGIPGFEDPIVIADGLPVAFDTWSGDQAVVVPATPEILPFQGDNMLQFIGTTPLSDILTRGADEDADVWQLIDVESLSDLLGNADADFEIELEYFANRIAASVDTDFVATIQAHMGDAAMFDPAMSLVEVTETVSTDADPGTWESVSTIITKGDLTGLPDDPEITFFAIKLTAVENNSNEGPLAPEFAGHYADGVSLELRITSEVVIPDPTVLTSLSHTIVFGNGYATLPAAPPDDLRGIQDVDVVGMTDDDPPEPLLLSVESRGYNLIGGGNVANALDDPPNLPPFIPPVFVFNQPGDMVGVDPLLTAGLVDVGGSTPVFYPTAGSPILDAGDPGLSPTPPGFSPTDFEQRGRHFSRFAGGAIDIGAVEAQQGLFVVDSLDDEDDRSYSPVFRTLNIGGIVTTIIPGYDVSGGAIQFDGLPVFFSGDFSLREAIDFSEKNPGPDIISFQPGSFPELLTRLEDPTFSPAPTIELDLATVLNFFTPADPQTALTITQPVSIIGPTTFELEIDASGNDITPEVDNNDGTRVFSFNDFSAATAFNASISNLTILGGEAVTQGGGIFNNENLTLTNSTIRDNAAVADGAGIFSRFGNLVIDSSTLHDNRVGSAGGAVYVDSKFVSNPAPITATVRNSTISGNTAGFQGAGIYNKNGEVLIEYSTITENIAPIASGVASNPGVDAFTRVSSSIIAGNFSAPGQPGQPGLPGDDITLLPGATNIVSLGFNLVGTGNAVTLFTQFGDMFDELNPIDPMLGPLVNTGGLAPTHRLLPGSPAIDAGSPIAAAGVGGVPLFDQRGIPFSRVFDGVLDGDDRIDIGAYEIQSTTFIVDSVFDENDGVTSAGNFSLREAIEASNANPFADTITFDPSLIASGEATIFQASRNQPSLIGPGLALQGDTPTDIRITDSVNIVGLGSTALFLDGSLAFVDFLDQFELIPADPLPTSRFFTIDDGDGSSEPIDVNISNLTFRNSINTEGHGGAIKSVEDLTLTGVEFRDNQTLGDGLLGGAVFQSGGSLILDGARFSANETDGVDSGGGALYVDNVNLDIIGGTQFVANFTRDANSGGGAVFANNSTVMFDQISIVTNSTAAGNSQGAGVYAANSNLHFSNVSIFNNITSGAQSRGAGIFALNSDVTVDSSSIGSNRSVGTFAAGGGIFSAGGTLNVFDSDFLSNVTQGAGSGGAGLAGDGAEILVERSTFSSNSTIGEDAPGGAINVLNGNLAVHASTISGNAASGLNGAGGGVSSDTDLSGSQKTSIFNSTVSGNTAGKQGGGIFNQDGLTEIKYSTVTNNTITSAVPFGFGSGVGSYGNTDTRTEVRSSIIAGNSSSDVDRVDGDFLNSFVSLGYNIVGDGLSSSVFGATGDTANVADSLLLLGPLANNGGPTRTHALLENSPAIDSGDPAARSGLGEVPALDQKGTVRVQGPRIDIGAFESAAASDFDRDGDVDGADFLSWQRGLGTPAPNAIKSDGDADNDRDVDGLDLGIWESGFGDPPSGAPLSALSGEGGGALSAGLLANSEPLLVSPVFSSSQSLTGLTLSSTVTSSSEALSVVVAAKTVGETEVGTSERDRLFAAFAPLAGPSDYSELVVASSATEEQSDEALEFSVEDQVFESLGAG